MKTKIELLAEIQEGLVAGVITEEDLSHYISHEHTIAPPALQTLQPVNIVTVRQDKLSAVDVMFYIAGLVLYSAIVSMIVQSWNGGNAFVHILLSAGVGSLLWGLAYYLIRSQGQNDVRNGLTNALLLTGSLSLVTGGYIVTNELIGGFGDVNFVPAAFMLAFVGGVHIAFDRIIKKDLVLLMGVLLLVASFPAIMFGLLEDANVPMDVWAVVLIISAGLLSFATRVVARRKTNRPHLRHSFDSLAAFLALISIYVPIYGDYGFIWLLALVFGVLGIFYLSIVTQNKNLLGNASFFLVLGLITISFKYFSGYGITVSLVLATIGMLGSAAVASGINKKYFKEGVVSTTTQ